MAESKKRRRGWLIRVLAVVIVILLLLLLLPRGCEKEGPFDYFRERASELDKDPARVTAYVRDEVEALDYRGDVKGALGALWGEAGSPEEKLLLLRALLAHCSDAPAATSLDDIAPDRDRDADADAQTFRLSIVHRQWLGEPPEDGAEEEAWAAALLAAEPRDTPLYDGPIAHLVGDVHSVEVTERGVTLVTVRAGGETGPVEKRISTAGALGEELSFRVERPGEAEPLRVVRELWRADNRVGPDAAGPGDRHDFVVLPCRVSAYVREKEKVILGQRGRDDAREAEPYDALLDYSVGSDELLADIEGQFEVRARFSLPRIHILSAIGGPEESPEAFDLRLGYTDFMGDPVDGYTAAHVRGLLESGLEHSWLARRTGGDVRSAFDTFNRLRDEYPDRPDRRVKAIVNTLSMLVEHGGAGARAIFGVKDSDGPSIEAVWTEDGLRVRGGRVLPAFAKALAGHDELRSIQIEDGSLDQLFTNAGDAAAAIETVLLASDGDPSVPADYVLAAELQTGSESLLSPSARFAFEWEVDGEKVRQSVQVTDLKGELEYTFHTRRGLRTAAGQLTVAARAVAEATRHNPHYRSGTTNQENETSFCVSRRVYAALSEGVAVPFTVLGPYDRTDDPDGPRPVAWEGSLEPGASREVEVRVNGRVLPLAVLTARLTGDEPAPFAELAVLDDRTWPVGRADALVSIQTSVRGRLMDENGLGIGGAHVQAGVDEGGPSCVTWPDGRFRLPPPREGDGHGTLTLVVKQKILDDVRTDEIENDLSAAGLNEVRLEVERLRHRVIWIGPREGDKLDALALSEQVKRHVRNDLAAGRAVAIPEAMIADGLVGAVGYYAYDPRTGHILGVTEDGLHGSMANWAAYGRAAKKTADAAYAGRADFGAASPLHAMRGANAAMFLFAGYRLKQKSAEEVALRLLDEMESWEERTNLFARVEQVAGAEARGRLAGALGQASGVGGLDGDSAKAAFYAGYIVATAFLHHQLE